MISGRKFLASFAVLLVRNTSNFVGGNMSEPFPGIFSQPDFENQTWRPLKNAVFQNGLAACDKVISVMPDTCVLQSVKEHYLQFLMPFQ